MRTRSPAAASAACWLLAACLAPAAAALADGPVALSDCRLRHPAGLGSVPARCGTLEVAENPAEPLGRRIRLEIALVPALAPGAGQAPLFIVAGGPGQAASDFYAAYAAAFAPAGRSRDLVILDQRGTGGSNPLKCDFPDDFDVAAPPPAEIRRLSAACRAQLPGRPEYYTTSVAVLDLEAVRVALGYPRIALYGVSYGTRVVQHYVRHHAAHVAAVVLDGVLPPDRVLGPDTPLDAERALDMMFARCHADPGCEHAFPGLAARFRQLLAALGERSVRVTVPDPATAAPRTVEFDRAQLAGAVRLLNYYSATTALLPLYIERASRGDYAPFASELLALSQHLDEQLAYGMNAAVACSEDVPAYAAADRARLATTYLGDGQLDELRELCSGWPAGVVDQDLFAPLRSDVPALLLSGEADPVTPPTAGARAAAGFRHGLHVVVRGQGHGQLGVGCAPQLIARFLTAGSVTGLDASCLAVADADPFVIDAAGPAP
jgi:pimeloyl-ACP methyl ester carboxylesterase